MVLLQGLMGWRFLISEVPLQNALRGPLDKGLKHGVDLHRIKETISAHVGAVGSTLEPLAW